MDGGGQQPDAGDELRNLLESADGNARERAWAEFVRVHSRLILHVARSVGGEHDAIMDRYAYVLERLAEDDSRRLREFVVNGPSRFTTWLVVIVRRLCLDHHRHKYGRVRENTDPDTRRVRRHLADYVATSLEVENLVSRAPGPERQVREREIREHLREVVNDLSARDRLLLALRFNDDYTARRIAEMMGFPSPFHVYRRLNGVLRDLRRALEQRGVDDPRP
jgi:RNA polymerase sigma factor (sigma-70 family)